MSVPLDTTLKTNVTFSDAPGARAYLGSVAEQAERVAREHQEFAKLLRQIYGDATKLSNAEVVEALDLAALVDKSRTDLSITAAVRLIFRQAT